MAPSNDDRGNASRHRDKLGYISEAVKDSPTSERVGRYQLLEPIGTGPCGVVSRAKVFGVAGFERQFAVKRFHPELTITNALAQALSAAARAYGSLEHPRIARMSEFGVAQGTTFTAVELVAGLDAARLVAEARLAGQAIAAGGALALISQAARAVGYAHGRGLTHLGLAPTNVIVNVDGDVKITDFGILAAGLPQRPVDVARLQHRVQYLAPEQVANEATSAATDVFALGVIAYELVTGQRTFRGDTPQQIAQSIMAGPPSEPALPRPIVRVLHRCLARSPFERFPDARALADALDAALRVAPVPGTRKDVGAQVKAITERLQQLNESEMSGMVALHVGTGPVPKQAPSVDIPTLGRDAHEAPTSEFVRPDVPVPGPAPLVGPATTMPDMPRPMTTMTGLPPPPIPVPQGVVTLSSPPPPPPRDAPATLLGIKTGGIVPPKVPVIPPRPPGGSTPPAPPAPPAAVVPVIAKPAAPPIAPKIPTRAETEDPTRERDLTGGEDLNSPPPTDDTKKGIKAAPPAVVTISAEPPPARSSERNIATSEMSPLQAEQLREAAAKPPEEQLARVWRETSEFASIQIENADADAEAAEPIAPMFGAEPTEAEPTRAQTPSQPPPTPPGAPPRAEPAVPQVTRGRTGEMVEGDSIPSLASAQAVSSSTAPMPMVGASAPPAVPDRPVKTAKSTSKLPLLIGGLLVAAGGAGVVIWQLLKTDGGTTDAGGSGGGTAVATSPPDAAAAKTTPDAAQVASAKPDAAEAKTPPVDAAEAKAPPVDAAQVAKAPPDAATAQTPTSNGGPSDQLVITSTPAGARVYIDGSDAGATPLKREGSPDRHTIALLLPGHDLYIAQVDGHGAFAIPLKEVTPPAGPAGIKVLKCKDKDRYYVYVDGKPTGMMCPTERIETDVGPHTVEVYDAVSEAKKKWDIVVKDTRLSHRIKIE